MSFVVVGMIGEEVDIVKVRGVRERILGFLCNDIYVFVMYFFVELNCIIVCKIFWNDLCVGKLF